MDTSPVAPGGRRHLLTMVCDAVGARAATTDERLGVCWSVGRTPLDRPVANLRSLIPPEDHLVVEDLLGRMRAGSVHVHRAAPSGATYFAYDGRSTDFNRILWYWQPAGDRPGSASGGLMAPGPEPDEVLARLTDRERAVVTAILGGSRVSTIARSLFLSPSTVRSHLSAAFTKLEVGSQAELIERFGPGGRPLEG